ncbi:hypothetical protein GCM10009603_01660 [Nocardiopsis exhalans]
MSGEFVGQAASGFGRGGENMKHECDSGFALEIPVASNGVEWDRQQACGLWVDFISAVQGMFFGVPGEALPV